MTIDNGVLDEDHRSLIGLVNQIQEIQPGLMMRSELRLVLTRLHAYAKFHFEREEHLQIAIGFPYAAAHNQGHRSITT
jgi:hemerythrin